MTNVLTLLRRELGHTFRSALAYVFLVLFVFVVQLLYLLEFFKQHDASMGRFFQFLPWLVVIFASLVTMRSWAEERQENTFEMLLTFPMRDWELVIAKWLATFLFLIVGIACTGTLPIMVATLGDPDPGPIFSGYAGAVLIAAMWCATGVFFSGLTRSQLLAALSAFVLGMTSLFVGTQDARILIDSNLKGFGSLLNSMIGTWSHYAAMSRGVIELADVLFFLVWVAVFLYLNVLYVGWRRRPQRELVLATCTVLAIGCGLLGSRLLADTSIARADLTEEKLYSLSDGTVAILQKADVPVRATIYISPRDEMPSELENLEQDLRDRLDEMRLRSGGMLDVHVVHMSVGAYASSIRTEAEMQAEEQQDEVTLDEDAKIERQLAERGVQPFQVASYETTRVTQEWVYATLGLTYREKDEELIHQMVPARLPDLESLVASTVSRLIRDAPPRIALHLGKPQLDPQMQQLYRQAGQPLPGSPYTQVADLLRQEKFDVVRTGLTQHEQMPESYDALVVVGPTGLDDRARYEINKALVSGKPVLIAAQNFTWEYPRSRSGAVSVRRKDVEPGVAALLSPQGVTLSPDILMQDKGKFPLTIPSRNLMDALRGGLRVDPPMHVAVLPDEMNADHAITERLDPVYYLWGSALRLDEERLSARLLKSTTLLSTTDEAWEVAADAQLRGTDLQPQGKAFARFPLMVEIAGQFEDTFAGQPRPKWTPSLEFAPDGRPLPAPPDTPETTIVPAPGRLLLVGCASMWQNGILGSPGNADLLVNAVSSLTLDHELLSVRSKKAKSRKFEEPSQGKAVFWMVVPLGIVPTLLIALGLSIGIGRMRARERWNAQHGR